MRAESPQAYGEILRWMHVAVATGEIGLAVFMRHMLNAGRSWLLWGLIAIRVLGLPVNFFYGANLAYLEIIDINHIEAFGGEVISQAVGVRSPFEPIFNRLADLILVAFLVDASQTAWRRGSPEERRRAKRLGLATTLFFLAAAGHATLLHAGLIRPPYIVTLTFLALLFVMSYELGTGVLRAAELSGELKQSEQRMDLAAEAAKLGLWAWNIRADDIWATDRCRNIFGVSSDEKIPFGTFEKRVHPDDREGVANAVKLALDGEDHYEREYRIQRPDGIVRWVRAWGRVERDVTGTAHLMRGVLLDVTEQKEIQARSLEMESDAVRHRNELAHLSRVNMLGELSGALAHELNQPLTAILSNAQAAQRFLAQSDPDLAEIREILKDIVEADRRAGDIIRRLRSLLRKDESSQQPLDMNELTQEVVGLVRSDLLTNGVRLKITLGSGLPLVKGDRIQLQQVLLNLLTNACDAFDGVKEPREVTVQTAAQDGGVDLTVADNGSGIPPEKLEQIFDAFFTTKREGMGLGLSICRTISLANHGKLWAENREMGGAIFHFWLPAHSPSDV